MLKIGARTTDVEGWDDIYGVHILLGIAIRLMISQKPWTITPVPILATHFEWHNLFSGTFQHLESLNCMFGIL